MMLFLKPFISLGRKVSLISKKKGIINIEKHE
jgi:hypothetical protein